MHFSQTSCHRHKSIREVGSEKNLEMKDLSTNHSFIYLDNCTQEQYLRSNTYDNKINQCDIPRDTPASVFSHLGYFFKHIFTANLLEFFCTIFELTSTKYYNNTYTAINIISKIINYALQ